MPGMKRTKKIIDALLLLGRKPSDTIISASREVMAAAKAKVESEGIDAYATQDDMTLIERLLDAVAADAEDMEKPAKGEEAKA